MNVACDSLRYRIRTQEKEGGDLKGGKKNAEEEEEKSVSYNQNVLGRK